MYQVLLDGRDLYYPGDEEYVISEGVTKLQLNDSGTFECNIPVNNPEYKNIKNRISMIKVLKDEKEIFYGEVRESEKDFNGTKQIYAVGELAFLFDSIQPQKEYHDLSPRQMLETWLNIHNSQVEDKKKFYVGTVTVHDTNDSLYRYTNRENTLDAIREKLVGRLGGYLRVRKEGGKRYLDYVQLSDYGKICEQPIMFGENLLDYSENISAEELYTAVIPLGAKIEEEGAGDASVPAALEKYVDITSVNNGVDYLYIKEAVETYGWCKTVATWDDVHTPSILKSKGEEWLRNNQFEEMALDLTAVDLSMLDQDYDSFELGDSVHAIAEPYGMDRTFPVQKMELYLQEPDKNTLVLGNTFKKDYIQQASDSNKKIDAELDKVHQTSNFLQSAIDNATQMMTGSKGGYKVTEFDENGRWLRDLYMNAPDKADATLVMQINMNGIGFSRDGFGGPYKNAWTIDGVLLGEFIKAHSIQAEALSTEYVSSVEKQIEDAETGAKEWAKTTITTSIKALEDEIALSVVEQREYVNGIEESLLGRINVTSQAITAEVARAKEEEGRLSSSLSLTSENITAEVTRAKKAEETLRSSIKINADSIENTVAKGEFESYLTQYYDRVLIEFNNDSKYVQITAGEIGIYNNGVTDSKKRAVFNQNGNHFYRDGYYVGKIGTNQSTKNASHKGLVFDLEPQGKYMAWAQRESSNESEYTVTLCYSRANSMFSEKGMHVLCNLDMHNWTIKNAKVEGLQAGGYSAYTGDIPIILSITDKGNGAISWQYSTLRVRDGIIVGYWN